MDTTLKDLWNNYILEKCGKIDCEKEEDLLQQVTKIQKEFQSELSANQFALLETYTDCLHEMNSFLTEKAFIAGIRFTTSYLIEALHEE